MITKDIPINSTFLTPILSMNFPPKGAAIPTNIANIVTIYPPLPIGVLNIFSLNWGINTVAINPQPTTKLNIKVIAISLLVK